MLRMGLSLMITYLLLNSALPSRRTRPAPAVVKPTARTGARCLRRAARQEGQRHTDAGKVDDAAVPSSRGWKTVPAGRQGARGDRRRRPAAQDFRKREDYDHLVDTLFLLGRRATTLPTGHAEKYMKRRSRLGYRYFRTT